MPVVAFLLCSPLPGEAMKQPVQRRLAAILAADVAGYSRLMGTDEEGTHQRLTAHLSELVEPKIGEHRGRTVKNTGDGFLAEFASVVDAVRFAAELQRGMADRNADTPEDKRIAFRIGINLGDVIADNDDIFGDGVNVAARLEALAEPGGICVSRVVRDQVRDRLPYAFEDMGEQSVKNIARPIRVYALSAVAGAALPKADEPATPRPAGPRYARRQVAALALAGVLIVAGGLWWLWSSPKAPWTAATTPPMEKAATPTVAPAAPRLSIVVLPFANRSDDKEQQYFADGITEDLTTDLSRIWSMLVISRNTAFTYKDKPVNAKQIGRELGVRYLLEGSVQRSGNQVRVNAQLIDAETDTHLWAERFERDIGDLFALQNEITGRIANSLGRELIVAEAARPTERPGALDYIFRGRATWAKGPARGNYAEAIGLFERALALDSRSVAAQILLANMLLNRVRENLTDSRAADIERAEGLVSQALAISPSTPMVHFTKGQLLRTQHRCEEAIPEYDTVLASDRNFVAALLGIGICKVMVGSVQEAIPLFEQTIRLDPRDPYVVYRYDWIGQVHLLQSRTDEAIVWLEKARSVNPGMSGPHAHLASAYALKGETERAAAELAEARRLSGEGSFSSIARLQAVGYFGVPKIRALYEATYFAGLRKAGMPDE
jgi:adenylate cyclase